VPETCVASTLVAASDEPTSPDDLWDLSRLFMSSWAEGIEVVSAWNTNIVPAITEAEKRQGFSGKPTRTTRFNVQTMNRKSNWRLLNLMRRQGVCRSLVPLYSDHTKTTGPFYWTWSTTSGGGGAAPLTSSVGIVNMTGLFGLDFVVDTGGVDGIVYMTHPDFDDSGNANSEPTFSGGGSPLTLGLRQHFLPSGGNWIMFRDTVGNLSQNSLYTRAVTDPDTDDTFTVNGSLVGATNGAGLHVTDTPFARRAWGHVSTAELAAKGWIDGDGVLRFRFRLIPFGTSAAHISLPDPAPSTIPCDTRCRRFFPGARVAWGTPARDGSIEEYEIGTIASVADDYIALATPASRLWGAGARVYPMLECDVVLESTAPGSTDTHLTATFLCRETPGASALPPLDYPESLGNALDGYPIFAPPTAFNAGEASVGWSRRGSVAAVGLGFNTRLYGEAPRMKVKRPYRALSRRLI
jgi:hypothetical protein